MHNHFSRKEGVALITTLMIIALLVAVVTEFNRIAIADIDVARNFGDEKKILYMTVSGVNAIKKLLEIEGAYSPSDHLLEDWAKSRTYFESASSMIEEGRLEGKITDENGKINLNRIVNEEGQLDEAQKAIWGRLLGQSRFGLTEEQVNTIIYGVKDWIDQDDEITGIYGAEDDFYKDMDRHSKNAPMEQVEEMLLVKGITEEIFFGDQYKSGIHSYFTVYGDGKININTAPVPVLMALSDDMNESIALEMDKFRTSEANKLKLGNKNWYREIWPFENPLPESILATTSDTFSLQITGTLNESVKHIRATISRSELSAQIVYWQEM